MLQSQRRKNSNSSSTDSAAQDTVLRPMLLIAYNPELGSQRRAYFVVPADSVRRRDIEEIRAMYKHDPEETSYDDVTVALGRKLDAIVAGNARPLNALVQPGEALVDTVELRHAIISTSVAG